MKYSEIELQCEDLLWFGLDNNNYIISFTTGGIGCVPDFVCNSKEETLELQDFFLNHFDNNSSKNSESLSLKGLFCFDVNYDDNGNSYIKKETPNKPILLDELPETIKTKLVNNRISIDVTSVDKIIVKHAF